MAARPYSLSGADHQYGGRQHGAGRTPSRGESPGSAEECDVLGSKTRGGIRAWSARPHSEHMGTEVAGVVAGSESGGKISRTQLRIRRTLAESKRTMKAIQVKQAGGPEAMELVDLPIPQPKPNEAVAKLAASGVNFVDVYFREGRYKAPLPLVLGQAGAAVVNAVRAEGKSVKPADHLAAAGLLASNATHGAQV